METLKKNWPLFACTLALISAPNVLHPQSVGDVLGKPEDKVLNEPRSIRRELTLMGLELNTVSSRLETIDTGLQAVSKRCSR